MRISDWSSDVCSSDLRRTYPAAFGRHRAEESAGDHRRVLRSVMRSLPRLLSQGEGNPRRISERCAAGDALSSPPPRSEEHTSELQSLMRISYAVFCLKKKKKDTKKQTK